MIDALDKLLEYLLGKELKLTGDGQIGFQPPDEMWRQTVAGLSTDALNVYLFDLRENRKLRSNERVRSITNGQASETPAPARLDCHYLISAWSPAEQSPAIEPTVDEHRLLYGVTAVLMKSAPLKPAAIYGEDPSLKNNWGPFWDMELPTEVLPAEGFPKLAEFWGAMGANNRWKPVVYLVVTLPVAMPPDEKSYFLVTGSTIESKPIDEAGSGGYRTEVTGKVLADNIAVVSVFVRLETPTNKPLATAYTDRDGAFVFTGLRPGFYQLRWHATGYSLPEPRSIEIKEFESTNEKLTLSKA
jgi:hypothetical protein